MSDQVFNNETTFTQKAEFLKDVYIYGTLYYDFVGFGTDLTVEDINITKQANIANLYVSGLSTFVGASALTIILAPDTVTLPFLSALIVTLPLLA